MRQDTAMLIHKELSYQIDWVQYISLHIDASTHGLSALTFERGEIKSGIKRQLEILSDLSSALLTQDPLKPSLSSVSEHQLFVECCRAFSFFPGNWYLLEFFRYLWSLFSSHSLLELINATKSKFTFLHISCAARLKQAFESVKSFGSPITNQRHLVVVGSDSADHLGFSFSFQNGLLRIPVGDAYELHYQKTLYLYSLLGVMSTTSYVVKLDDDLWLSSRPLLESALQSICNDKIDYAGSLLRPSANPVYQGWHIGKCNDSAFEMHSLPPCMAPYMAGGSGYVLSRKALGLVGTHFLSAASLYLPQSLPLMEDQLVGSILYAKSVHTQQLSPQAMGLSTGPMRKYGISELGEELLALQYHLENLLPHIQGWPV